MDTCKNVISSGDAEAVGSESCKYDFRWFIGDDQRLVEQVEWWRERARYPAYYQYHSVTLRPDSYRSVVVGEEDYPAKTHSRTQTPYIIRLTVMTQ